MTQPVAVDARGETPVPILDNTRDDTAIEALSGLVDARAEGTWDQFVEETMYLDEAHAEDGVDLDADIEDMDDDLSSFIGGDSMEL